MVLLALLIAGMNTTARAADPVRGQEVYKTLCSVCHAAKAGENQAGPTLFGVVGRQAATVSGFRYSPNGIGSLHLVWDPETLDTYLTAPKAMVPGTTMVFAGLRDPARRADLIAFLQTLK